MTNLNDAEIRKAVSERYAARARKASAAAEALETVPLINVAANADACCEGDSCCTPAGLTNDEASFLRGVYAHNDTAGLPAGAIEAAAGCGNPTAIAELRPGEDVLDLGSGGGIDCFLAAKQVGPGGQVVGVDMTPEMVALARRNAEKVGATNVRFKLGEIEDLPLPDNSVDVIISNCVINLSTDKPRVFHEAFRVLRPGGRLRVSDMVWIGERPADAAGAESWAGCIAGALPVEEYLSAIRAAGFVESRADPRPVMEGSTLASALVFAEKPAV